MASDETVISGQDHDEEVVQVVIDSLPTLYYLIDAEGRIVRWNLKSMEVTGYSAADHQRLNVLELFEGADRAHIAQRMQAVFEKGEADVEARLTTKDGRKIPHHFSGKRINVQGRAYLSGVGIDISERKALEDRLMLQATTDSLTGVFNRRHFLHLAEQELARAQRYGSPLSLLMPDLDHFKSINDQYGHQTGDAVLQELMRICPQGHSLYRRRGASGRGRNSPFCCRIRTSRARSNWPNVCARASPRAAPPSATVREH